MSDSLTFKVYCCHQGHLWPVSKGLFRQQLCMLIPLVWFAGKDSGTGTAVAAWERRTRGGAVQAKHSLALVSG